MKVLTTFALFFLCVFPALASDQADKKNALSNAAFFLVDHYGNPTLAPLLDELATATLNSKKIDDMQHQILISHPALNENSILFVSRRQYTRDHHNTATIFQTGEINTASFVPGGALKILELRTGTVDIVFETLDGMVRDPELSPDGKRIIFSYRKNIDHDYHICEIDVTGENFRQLTSAKGVADIDPVYTPAGDIIFTSTREPKYCMCNRHIMGNLYRMNADGANILQIGKSTLFEGHASVLPDGRILYDRWEYVDRNFGDAQGLWTVWPDGVNHAVYYGNNTNSPGGVIDARPVPGTDEIICTFTSCHDRPWGALALVNRSLGIDGKTPVLRTWPENAKEKIGIGNWDKFMELSVRYEDPYPLDEAFFLCSKSINLKVTGNGGAGEKMGLFIVDRFGNEALVYEEPGEFGCYDPMPVRPLKSAHAVTDRTNLKKSTGSFYVMNVYKGAGDYNIKPGSVKYLRVIESPEKRTWVELGNWGGQGQQNPGMNWHSFENKRILGDVPVHDDGSAYVTVPAETFVYFQLLDKDKKMIHSMRSGTMLQPGETTGCVGCHESRHSSPAANFATHAVKQEAKILKGLRGEQKLFNYMTDVQPVFDRHCVSCHDFDGPAAQNIVLAGDRNPYFNASYVDLYVKKLVTLVGGGPAETQSPYSWGSHASRLIKVLDDGHHDVTLPPEDYNRLITWLDINGPYYPVYESAYPDNIGGRCPLNDDEMTELGKLVDLNFFDLSNHQRTRGPQISFDRPEKSPCLQTIKRKTKKYKKALALIQLGHQRLQQTPRADMDRFVPCEQNLAQLRKYVQRQQIEIYNKQAAVGGMVVKD
jgi:hypothetical protein